MTTVIHFLSLQCLRDIRPPSLPFYSFIWLCGNRSQKCSVNLAGLWWLWLPWPQLENLKHWQINTIFTLCPHSFLVVPWCLPSGVLAWPHQFGREVAVLTLTWILGFSSIASSPCIIEALLRKSPTWAQGPRPYRRNFLLIGSEREMTGVRRVLGKSVAACWYKGRRKFPTGESCQLASSLGRLMSAITFMILLQALCCSHPACFQAFMKVWCSWGMKEKDQSSGWEKHVNVEDGGCGDQGCVSQLRLL